MSAYNIYIFAMVGITRRKVILDMFRTFTCFSFLSSGHYAIRRFVMELWTTTDAQDGEIAIQSSAAMLAMAQDGPSG